MNKAYRSLTEQVAQTIHEGIQQGRWVKTVPGRKRLAEELGVNHKTVQAAMKQLESQSLLKSQGQGKVRLIVASDRPEPKTLRVAVFTYEKSDKRDTHLLEIGHRLQAAGHVVSITTKSLTELGMDVRRVASYAKKYDTDAWVVVAGSHEVLEWFAGQKTPAFALYGRLHRIALASIYPKKADAMTELVDRLVDLGHKKIVLLTREERRKPSPGLLEKIFLEGLEQHGILTGSYNLPDWGNSPEKLRDTIHNLFRYTPPTALVVGQPSLCISVLQQFSQLGITAPRDVSLACTDYTEYFDWCDPSITHISWDTRPIVNRVVNWANNISRGKDDRRKSSNKAKLILGGTVGPVPK